MKARGAMRDGMHGANKLERAYALVLEAQRRDGLLLWWRYEAVRLRLADGAWYTPDFLVMTKSGELEAVEVKGFMREAARVRLLVAAEAFPFRFVLVRGGKQGWQMEEV